MKKAIVPGAVAVAGCILAIYQYREARLLRDEVQTLRQQQATQEERLEKLQRERDAAARQPPVFRDDNTRPNSDLSELLKLRGQVGVLSDENQRLRQAAAESQTAPGQTGEMVTRSKFSVSYDPAVWNIFASSPQSMTWALRSDSAGSIQVTVAGNSEQKDKELYKQEMIFSQGFRGDPADFVGERLQSFAGRDWTVLEFRNVRRKPPSSEIHYFLPGNDGYLTVFVTGEEARLPGHQETIDAFLRQIRVK